MAHRCCCALVHPSGRDVDRCPAWVASNDQPYCDKCETAGHDRHPWARPQLDREARR